MKDLIIQNPILRKEYSYTLKDVSLTFSLRQDNSHELTIFQKLLEAALKDVVNDIERTK